MLLKLVISCSILLSAAFVKFSEADSKVTKEEVVANANENSIECDIIPEITNIEGYEMRCVKKIVPVIIMKKNSREGRIVNQDGKDRSHRPGPYRRRTTTPRTYYYKKRTTTPRTYYIRKTTTPKTYYHIDRTDEYDDSDYYDDDDEYFGEDEEDDEEYEGFFELILDIFF